MWVSFQVQTSDSNKNRETDLASLRNKIQRHQTTRAHKIAQEFTEKGGQGLLRNMVRALSETVLAETDAVFRTAIWLRWTYLSVTMTISLSFRKKKGVNMGTSLHCTGHCSTKIIEHTAKEMQKKKVNSIVSSSSNLSFHIDKATPLSHKSAMIINVKASVDWATPQFVILELVELESQGAEGI